MFVVNFQACQSANGGWFWEGAARNCLEKGQAP